MPVCEAEIARAHAVVLAPEGFEERETRDELELAVYTDAHGEERFRHVFPSAETTAVEGGWEDRWREFHTAVLVEGVWIGPSWEAPPPDVASVVVEPGRAFGTGAHPTTRGCIELLARTVRGSLLDAGCGSGVLALAAARLGFGPIVAVDVDEAAVEAARANASWNRIGLDVRVLDLLREDLPSADVLVANVELSLVADLLRRWEGRTAITSGYLVHELPEVEGWSVEERLELEGWAAHRLVSRTTV